MLNEKDPQSILVPAPTAWPLVAALGITLVCTGLVTHPAVSVLGAAVLLRAAIGWWFDVLPEQKEEAVLVRINDRSWADVPKSSAAVDHLTAGIGSHRVRIPVEVHPYWTGLYGGLAGAIAMAVVAMLFGLIAQRSIWYPINLLAAGILPSLAAAPIDELRNFSEAGLIAGSLIHGTISLLVGLLYAVSLPMFPRGASWRSGLVTPVLWSGLVASSLGVINPTLNERIDWVWFIGSQVAFGLAAAWVIARTAKIETMQSWPLAERAGIEAQRKDADQSGSEEKPHS
jgi:hypothetical protein